MAERSEQNGPLKFNEGTEDRLAKYVLAHTDKNNPQNVVKLIDEFCRNNYWMMNLGDKKGEIVDKEIVKHKPKILVELGTYCAYSTIRFACNMPEDSKIYTIGPQVTDCATKLIKHAGLENKIVQLQGKTEKIIPTLTELKDQVDMVFINHAKHKYLPDLLLIEQYGLLHTGSVVAGDVVVFRVNDYLTHVRNSGLYSSSVNHLAGLVYDDNGAPDKVLCVEVSHFK